MILTLDDLIQDTEIAERLNMRVDNLRAMRKKDPQKYRLYALGLYVEDTPLDILVTSLEVVAILSNKIAIDRLIREHK